MPNNHPALLLCLLLTAATSANIDYLSLPFRLAQNETHQAHNIAVEINQFVYAIDVTLENTDDFVFELSAANRHHSPTSTLDYRKYNDSVYGIIRPIAVQRVDPRLSLLKRATRNTLNYLKNIEEKMVWTNQKYIKQISWSQKGAYLSEGSFNIGPSKKIIAFDDVLKYSRYMNSPTVTWQLHANAQQGHIMLGHFPTDQLQDSQQYQQIRIRTVLSSWLMDIIAIKLKVIGETRQPLNQIQVLTNVTSQFKVNLSEKRFKVPKSAMDSLAKYLPGCQQALSSTGGYPLVCQTDKIGFYSKFALQLITQGGFEIDIPLRHLMYNIDESNNFIMNIELGVNDDYQISPFILKEHLVGINYRSKHLFIGRKASDSFLDRYILFKIFIGLNVLALIASLLVISMARRFQKPAAEARPPQQMTQRAVWTSKTGGYLMPDEDQHSPHEEQKIIQSHRIATTK